MTSPDWIDTTAPPNGIGPVCRHCHNLIDDSTTDHAANCIARSPVMAATAWPSNADMIVDMVRLGYLTHYDVVLDPTYGSGRWWKKWRPTHFFHHTNTEDGSDFRNLPYPDNFFDAVTFDPPYVCVGGRKTSGIKSMYDGYGLTDAPTTPIGLQLLINDGLKEMARVVKPKGIILVKNQDYISSGKLWLGTHHTLCAALDYGLLCVDRFEHIGNPRPQPSGRRQVHARRNLSTLFVFRKP